MDQCYKLSIKMGIKYFRVNTLVNVAIENPSKVLLAAPFGERVLQRACIAI